MTSASAIKVAVIGSGISGAVCASTLAKNGIHVTVFEGARGPGGRMSQRREVSDDGEELAFDHGAPYFTATNPDVLNVIHDWECSGLVAEWNVKFGSFDCQSNKFVDTIEEDGQSTKYVGVPGMNSICRALCQEPGVESRFQKRVGRLEWLEDEDLWSLIGMDGEALGRFNGVVASDKNTFSHRFTGATGKPPPIDSNVVPEMASELKEVSVSTRYVAMVAFKEPLSLIHPKGISFKNSDVLSWAYCDSSKPGRSTASERWVLHSTAKYGEDIMAQTGIGKLTSAALTKIAEDLISAFGSTKLLSSEPFFTKAHGWGSAFPAERVATQVKCLWNAKKRLALCGDFCVSPNVEGAILSGMAAAEKFIDIFSLS